MNSNAASGRNTWAGRWRRKDACRVKSKRTRALFLMFCSAAGFAVMAALVKLSGDIPSFQKSFFRNFVALIVSAVILYREKVPLQYPKGMRLGLFFRCAFGTVGLLCNFYAVDHMVLADASILSKMDPFFCILFSAIFLKERFTPFQALTVTGAFIGSMFIVKPTFANMNLFPAMIGLMGGLSAGASFTSLRYLGKKRVPGALIVFSFSLFSTLVTLPNLLIDYYPMTRMQILLLAFAGIAASVAQFSVTAAYRLAPAKDISVYTYAQVLISAVLGFFLFSQIPDGYSILGYFIVCTMAVSLFLYNKRHDEEEIPLEASSDSGSGDG